MADKYLANIIQEMLLNAAVLRTLDISPISDSRQEPTIKEEDLRTKVGELYDKYSPLLVGTPENEYLLALAAHYQIVPREQVEKWSEPVEKYNFRAQVLNSLQRAGIFYKGQLVAKRTQIKRLRWIGKTAHDAITLALVNDHFDFTKPVNPTVLDSLNRKTIELLKEKYGPEEIDKLGYNYNDSEEFKRSDTRSVLERLWDNRKVIRDRHYNY